MVHQSPRGITFIKTQRTALIRRSSPRGHFLPPDHSPRSIQSSPDLLNMATNQDISEKTTGHPTKATFTNRHVQADLARSPICFPNSDKTPSITRQFNKMILTKSAGRYHRRGRRAMEIARTIYRTLVLYVKFMEDLLASTVCMCDSFFSGHCLQNAVSPRVSQSRPGPLLRSIYRCFLV